MKFHKIEPISPGSICGQWVNNWPLPDSIGAWPTGVGHGLGRRWAYRLQHRLTVERFV